MRRAFVACVLASLAIGSLVGPVAARPPGTVEGPPDSVVDFGADEVCPFDVRIEAWSNERATDGVDGAGNPRTVITGNALNRLTNLEADTTLILGNGGRVEVLDPGDGTIQLSVSGRTLFYFLPGDATPTGVGPGLVLIVGRAAVVLDLEADLVTSFLFQGSARDLCAELT
jgi:hypothetical protein